jgi:hypothetical protein
MRLNMGKMRFLSALLLGVTSIPAAHAATTPVDLGKAGNYVILTKTGITDVPASVITGRVGTSPITGAADHLRCTEVTGHVVSVDAAGPAPCSIAAPGSLRLAVGAMKTAYADAAGRTATVTELGAGNIGGLTLAPAVYKWSSGLLIPTSVTLKGGPSDVWIFQVAQTLSLAAAKSVVLQGGARPANIFWQVGGKVTLGSTSHFQGVILSMTAITLKTGATVRGRLLSQTAVTLEKNVITKPRA